MVTFFLVVSSLWTFFLKIYTIIDLCKGYIQKQLFLQKHDDFFAQECQPLSEQDEMELESISLSEEEIDLSFRFGVSWRD